MSRPARRILFRERCIFGPPQAVSCLVAGRGAGGEERVSIASDSRYFKGFHRPFSGLLRGNNWLRTRRNHPGLLSRAGRGDGGWLVPPAKIVFEGM